MEGSREEVHLAGISFSQKPWKKALKEEVYFPDGCG